MDCIASTSGTTLCCLMSMCWMGEVRSSFFVGIATLRITNGVAFEAGSEVKFGHREPAAASLAGKSIAPVRAPLSPSLPGSRQQNTHNRGRYQGGHCPGEHSTQPQPSQIIAPVRRQGSNAADLHPDGAKVGKSA